ncbi:MAG TPA: Rieske 2Fe-2S domain-containing protein [Thermoanaerobaculia bacterium]|nr:Rieske 2Fe-2S domain-containing protein [Thermoanaerobaculia bacterium]
MALDELARGLGDQESLDAIATPLQEAIRNLFAAAGAAGREAKNFLHGSALGHPLHPALIELPVGAWTLAAILDALEVAGLRGKSELADTAIKIGLVGAVGAAVAGAADWSETDGRAKRIGLTHGVLNLTAAGLYALSLAVRRRARERGIALSMTAFGIAMSSAFLGGHLTYGEQIGVDHTATADQDTPKKFTAVLEADALKENKPVKVTADGVAVVLVKQGDEIFALRETCTHLGGPLSEGKIDGDGIVCPWHGSRFCLKDGRVLDGPAVFPERVFDVRVRDGQIEVRALQ